MTYSTDNSALFFSWGCGVETITEACKHAGLPAPKLKERHGGVAVELVKTPGKTDDVASGRWKKRSHEEVIES